jgi:hypothetical protein
MLDSLAERYGMLPSQILESATTLDLWVFDVAVSYKVHVEKRERDKEQGHATSDMSQEDLLKGLEKFREDRSKR